MQRLKSILESSATSPKVQQLRQSTALKQVSKFISENHVPRYLLIAILTVKCFQIYEKCKVLIAVNNASVQLRHAQTQGLRKYFDSEAEF